MTLQTKNLTFCGYIAVDEKVRYTPHPVDSDKTLLTQEAIVTVQVSTAILSFWAVQFVHKDYKDVLASLVCAIQLAYF